MRRRKFSKRFIGNCCVFALLVWIKHEGYVIWKFPHGIPHPLFVTKRGSYVHLAGSPYNTRKPLWPLLVTSRPEIFRFTDEEKKVAGF